MTALDDRVSLGTKSTGDPFTGKYFGDRQQRAIKFMARFVAAGQRIEHTLRTKWGIPVEFDAIIFRPGAGYASAAVFGAVIYSISDLEDMNESAPYHLAIYAHELGHYLSMIDPAGEDMWAPEGALAVLNTAKRRESLLTQDGKLLTKYLEPIPYSLIPKRLIFVPENQRTIESNTCLSFELFELIANKICYQLVGFDEAKRYARRHIEIEVSYKSYSPWSAMHSYVLANEFGLTEYKEELFRRVDRYKDRWKGIITTQKLIERFIKFYRAVSLRSI